MVLELALELLLTTGFLFAVLSVKVSVLALLPDKLFDVIQHLIYFDVYDLGFTVVGAWPLLFVIYSVLAVVLVPVMYREFRTKQIR